MTQAMPEVRWPASPDIDLQAELVATARSTDSPLPLWLDGARAEEALPADAPGVRARSFRFGGLWVAEVILGNVDADAALPLVVMLHGRGDRPRIPGGPFGRVPTAMRVLIPRGPLALGDGYAWARHSVTENRHAELAADLVAMSRRLARLIRHVERTRPTVGSAIVTGFSQGALLAWTAGLRHPDAIGLVIPMAGWVPPGARPQPLSPALGPQQRAIHGTADPIVRIGPTRDLVRDLRDAGFGVDWVEADDVAHVVSPEMNRVFETWLEEGLRQRAPELEGGLGVAGEDPGAVEPYESEHVVEDEEAVPAPLPEETDDLDEDVDASSTEVEGVEGEEGDEDLGEDTNAEDFEGEEGPWTDGEEKVGADNNLDPRL